MPEAVVSFDEESSPWHTVCEVNASDRPGLLHDFAAALAAAGVDVQSARVTTNAGIATGRFDVINRFGAKLTQAGIDSVRSLIASGGSARASTETLGSVRMRSGRRLLRTDEFEEVEFTRRGACSG